MLIQDTDFDPSQQDPNAHALWLRAIMFFLFICIFSKEKAEMILWEDVYFASISYSTVKGRADIV